MSYKKLSDSTMEEIKDSFLSSLPKKKPDKPKPHEMAVCCPCKLTLKQRVIGFAICYSVGLLIDLCSFGALFSILSGHPERFAVAYSLGNLIALVGTGFLVGFCKQLKSMFDKTRALTTVVFLAAMAMTFVSALVLKKPILVLVFILIQFLAFFWYSVSFIPLGRTGVKFCLKRCVRCR